MLQEGSRTGVQREFTTQYESHVADTLFPVLLHVCVSACVLFVLCVCMRLSSEVIIDYIRATVQGMTQAMNPEPDLKHQGRVIIEIYGATES